ncbi:MAG: response regulator transcription factor [Thiofilum sp.]|uniref:response regulator transcription factor n=1 Tax=Thiofilum sp. TaxID=2212733 RepID=UPI0025D88AF5|nr:response regulator transcription factor [Thiofilum sp.]MBK8455383.1 response regulator transcription factor [Thiofilum sp.]
MLVLLIEDHRLLAENIIDYLASEQIEVDYAANGLQGLELAVTHAHDAILLDINLPIIDGFTLCQRLRSEYNVDTPILMLTARDELQDKLTGFERGADDYLIKPFEYRELVARIQALVKRHRGEVTQKRLVLGGLELDTGTQQVWRNGQEIIVSPTGFKILRLLMREHPQVVTRELLQREVWGSDIPDTDALRSHLYNLRKVLDHPFERELIQTVKGVGLKLAP